MIVAKHLTFQNGSAGFIALWGMWAALPGDLFSTQPALYAPMLDVVPSELFWGSIAMGFGLIAIGLSGFGRRMAAAFLLGFVYSFASVLYIAGDPISSRGLLWGWMGFFNMLYFLSNFKWFR